MRKSLLPNIEWFFPYLNGFEFFNNSVLQEIFKYSTDELLKNYKNSNDLISLLLTERFFLENVVEDRFFSQKLLDLVLEKREVPGYLFYFPNKSFWKRHKSLSLEYSFIKLDENFYFYPAEWGNFFKIMVYLWKKNVKFFSVEINLNKETSKEDIENYIELTKVLNFSYLSKKALDSLKTYLPTLEADKLLKVTNKFLKIPDSVLILSSKNGIRRNLEKNGAKLIEVIGKNNELLLIKAPGLNQLNSLLENGSKGSKTGCLPKEIWNTFGNKKLSPLMLLIGAFEHAKRVNGVSVKIFEGFTYHVIGDLYYEWKDLGKALECYSLARDYTKQPVELSLSESAIYYTFEDFEKAEKILKRELCGCKKEDPFIHYNLALIYLKKEENEKAKYHFYKAHLLNPENRIFRKSLIKCLWNFGEYEELENLLSTIKNLSAEEEVYLGKLYFLKKEYKKAFKYLKEILPLKERDGQTLIFLAWLYLHFNKEREVAEIFLKEAREILSEEEIKKIKREFNLNIL
ncbi:MAG: hypothetical protein J7K20_07680 [Thermodesulfobacterium sp.]|nr:hypothetical protein [Thermodesulfobacterium sp.]